MIDLTTMHFATDFDRDLPAVSPPYTVTSGRDGALRIIDGLRRGDRIVGRFEASPGLVGIKISLPRTSLDADHRRVAVAVTLSADGSTGQWWHRHVTEKAGSPHQPRLLVIRSQGATRGAALLGRRPADFGFRTRAAVRFTLDEADLSDDGILVVELAESSAIAASSSAPDAPAAFRAAVGVRIDRIEVTTSDRVDKRPVGTLTALQLERFGAATTGVPARARSGAELASDFFLVSPPAADPTDPADAAVAAEQIWTLRAGLVRPVRPDSPRPSVGPLLAKRPTGAAAPRIREKAIALIRRRLGDVAHEGRNRLRHCWVRASRAVVAPVAWLAAGPALRSSVRRGRVHAELIPLSGADRVRCVVARSGRRSISVTLAGPLTEPAIVRLCGPDGGVVRSRRLPGYGFGWHLVSARFRP